MRTGAQALDAKLAAIEDHDDWAKLHDELRILPASFREPLILCYLEGLTQDQAAAHLHCPIGTIQSRLARGRAKLKARLEKRGLSLSSAFAGDGHLALQSCSAPPAWADATVKLAMQFTHGNGAAIAGASAATVALAEEVARAIIMSKLKVTAAMIFFAAVLVTGAAAWAMHDREAIAPIVAAQTAAPLLKPEPEHPQEKALALPKEVTRTIRGIVRDDQGRPVPKAWIGNQVVRRNDAWQVIEPLDRIRACTEPFRDERGKIVPAGALGKYYEMRDQEGKWQPIHPADIKRCEGPPFAGHSPFDPVERTDALTAALKQGRDVFEVRVAKDRWLMRSLSPDIANRTDPQGNFSCKFGVSTESGEVIHFASPDFSKQAIHVFQHDDLDKPVDITLRSVRQVRARVIETPTDRPEKGLRCDFYSLDPSAGKLDEIPAIREKGGFYMKSFAEPTGTGERHFDVRLPIGHYKVGVVSETLYRMVDVVVPPGNGPLALPDIHVETLAWAQMLGKPAAEIDAVDLEGKPVTLADYRGKVTVLAFWSSKHEPDFQSASLLRTIQERLKGQPVAILALHDASLSSPASLEKALEPIRAQFAGKTSIRFLLDRAPTGKPRDRYSPRAGEDRSGRTADIYESWDNLEIVVIDKNGKLTFAVAHEWVGTTTLAIGENGELVGNFAETEIGDDDQRDRTNEMALLERVVEDGLGLPRSQPSDLKPAVAEPPKDPSVLKGKVVDLDGRPIAGAKVSGLPTRGTSDDAVTTDLAGDFTCNVQQNTSGYQLTVEAAGFASRSFFFMSRASYPFRGGRKQRNLIDSSGLIPDPLKLGPGVVVLGRVVRNGKPAAGVPMELQYVVGADNPTILGNPETITDASGLFRFPHTLATTDFWVHSKLRGLADGATVVPQRIHTTGDGTTLDLGELHVEKGRTLAGRVVCSSGTAIPAGTALFVAWSPAENEVLDREVDKTGRSEFNGLPAGPVRVTVMFGGERSATGYHVSVKNACRNPGLHSALEGQLDRDVNDLTILLEPGAEPENDFDLDPALEADFNDAKAGPITGVPPRP